jgi:hypothetical protein
MGYILDGKYHRGSPDLTQLRSRQQSTYKQHEQNRQRKDYAKEIIQPYGRDGKPNPDFIDAYHSESVEYGFLPNDEQLKKE